MFKCNQILSFFVAGVLLFTAASSMATSNDRPSVKVPIYKKIGTKIKSQYSLAKKGIKGWPVEFKANQQFIRAIKSDSMLGQIYKREKKLRHTGWGQLATLSLWSGYGASLGAAFGLPGSQPVASFLAGSLAVTAVRTQVKVSRAYEAARTDTIRFALRLGKNVDQKILSHYGQLLVGAASKDLTAATAQLKKAKAQVKITEEGYLQHEVSYSNRITHWFSSKKHGSLNKKLNGALAERVGSEERVNALTAELEQLTSQFSTK